MKADLSPKQLIIMSGALFSMHFGASCMLFPVTWGKESGSSFLLAYIAIVLSAILLPLLAYFALARGNGNFYSLTERILPKFGRIFCSITVLVMGPLYVIPRMSAASWDALMQLLNTNIDSHIPIFLFNLIYYAITYWFVASRSDTVDKIGKILFPILILIVLGVIGKGLVTPITGHMLPKTYEESALVYGFLQGYQTGDLPAALLFGFVIIQGIRKAKVPENRINHYLMVLGLMGLGFLALTHLGHMIVGAFTAGTIDLTLSSLYAEIVLQLWGTIGGVFFNIALIFAALTTAVGLSGSTAEFFEEVLDARVSYNKVALATVVVSTLMASMGLGNIVKFIGPLLDACYPACIILVLFYVIAGTNLQGRFVNGTKFAMIGALIVGFVDAINVYNELLGINNQMLTDIYTLIPLSSVRLTWVPISSLCFIIGVMISKAKRPA
ncbi:branched-chain amino acid transport system II carrier protein [Peptococcus simiae]|uniref:branched-chain amino acid transport system II carrier protein n=1 Tax=Peptococcus simiae TaxID=1643805 RepID=UPI0039817E8A